MCACIACADCGVDSPNLLELPTPRAGCVRDAAALISMLQSEVGVLTLNMTFDRTASDASSSARLLARTDLQKAVVRSMRQPGAERMRADHHSMSLLLKQARLFGRRPGCDACGHPQSWARLQRRTLHPRWCALACSAWAVQPLMRYP